MIDLAIVVEGATEEMFVRSILKAYLKCKDVDPEPFQIGAGRSGCGGNVTIDELASDMHTYYEFYGFNAVTSLVDFYGFSDEDGRSPDQLVEAIQNKLREISQNKNLTADSCSPMFRFMSLRVSCSQMWMYSRRNLIRPR